MAEGARRDRITARLEGGLAGLRHLEVIDESHRHSVPPGSESHFKVVLVADEFEDKPLLARHRRVNALLADELAGGVHALAIHAWTGSEWAQRTGGAPMSPPCLGGGKAERSARRD